MTRHRSVMLLLVLATSLLSACASPGVGETGIRIGDETLKQFKAGSTTEDWLVAVVGPPTGCACVRGVENTKVLRYASGEQSTGIIAAITGRSTRGTAVTYFVVTNGIVTRFWADRAKEFTALGSPVEADPGAKKSEP